MDQRHHVLCGFGVVPLHILFTTRVYMNSKSLLVRFVGAALGVWIGVCIYER